MELTLKITTLCDTQIGSGRSFGATIDSDIEFDQYGLPYIPAKRIKGLFRNAVENLCELNAIKDLRKFDETQVIRLFGKRVGDKDTMASIDIENLTGAPVRFDNLMIEEHENIYPWIRYLFDSFGNAFNPHIIQEHFTTLRSQTAIDKETKTAQDHSLRTFRVLKKDFSFCGKIHLEEDEDKDAFLNALSMATLLLRRIGGQRNRGFGKVEVELFGEDRTSLTNKLKEELKGARQ